MSRLLLVKDVARELIEAGCNAGKPLDAAATVGEVAAEAGVSADEVVRLIQRGGDLMQVDSIAGAPIEDWIVWEDGE